MTRTTPKALEPRATPLLRSIVAGVRTRAVRSTVLIDPARRYLKTGCQ